jgi:autotransporter-associated beta strand protein
MKLMSTRRCASAIFIFSALCLALVANQIQAATSYFDTNGITADSGITANASYLWESPFWNSAGVNDANAANGVSATTNWTDGDFPRFAAGINANGLTYTVTANSNHTIAGMQLLIGAAFTGGPSVNGGATVNVNNAGGAVLSLASGQQGFFVSTNGNLKINSALGGVDGTSQVVWQGGGGSLYLYGANTFAGGVQLNAANGLNFNNSASFGPATAPITFGSQAATSATTSLTYVIANPDVGPVTIPNPVTERSFDSVNFPALVTTNLIYTGKNATFSSAWTLGTGMTNALTIANSSFTTATLTLSGGVGGAANSNLTVNNNGTGIFGTLILTGASTYGGTTTIGSTASGQPALQATQGVGLPTNFLNLNGGVYQGNGAATSFTRSLGISGANKFQWNTNGGGFSANGGQMTVNIGGAGAGLVWGGTIGSQIVGTLDFGSGSANDKTLFQNPVDLNNTATTGLTRTVNVVAGTGGDSAEMSGVISNSNASTALTKTGTGTLILSAPNSYTGATTVGAGTLSVSTVGVTGSNSNVGTNGTIHLGATTTAGTLKYTGTGETSDKVLNLAGTTAGGTIDQSGTGLLRFTNNLTATGAGAKTLTLQGSTAGTGEIAGTIVNSSSATSVTKAGTGTWTLSGTNTYTGTTAVNAGTLVMASAGAVPGANALTLGGGTLNNSTSATKTISGATTLSANSTIAGANDINFSGAFTNSAGNRTLTANNTAATFGTVNLTGDATARSLTFAGPGNVNLNGVVQNGGTATSGTLVFNSTYSGTATISQANTYAGTTTLSAGTFVLGNKAAFGTSAVGINGVSMSANTNLSGANAIGNTATLGATNTFTGANNIQFSGTVTATGSRTITNNMSGANLTLSGPVNLSSNATNNTVTIGGTGNTTISGAIANGGTATASNLTKSGNGILALTGANTYAGVTTINGGTLAANNTSGSATGTGAIVVNSGGTLAGTGSVSGAVTVNSGGKLSPGASPESLAVGALSLMAGSAFIYEINSSLSFAAGADLVNVALGGNTVIDTTGAGVTLSVSDLATTPVVYANKFTLLSYDATKTPIGTFAGTPEGSLVTIGVTDYSIHYADLSPGVNFDAPVAGTGFNYVTLTAVPEARSFLLVGLVCVVLGAARLLSARRLQTS